jgi:RNA polymerase sigma-70 factor, ECF subfamily
MSSVLSHSQLSDSASTDTWQRDDKCTLVTMRSRARRTSPPRSTATDRGMPEQLTDEELLSGYRDTSGTELFDELVRRYAGDLRAYLSRYLANPTLADDVLQDTFLQVHRKCGLYGDGRPARSWLFAIATHRAVDSLRRWRCRAALSLDRPSGFTGDASRTPCELLTDDDRGPLARLQDAEQRQWLWNSVARLSRPLRETVWLAYFQGLKGPAIAEFLQLPLGTVKSRLHAAIVQLRKLARNEAD